MKNIDKEMIKNKVNELVIIENHKRYILRCDLEKLETFEKECVLNYISDKNIKIVDYEITKENRTSLVDEFDYGYVSGYEIGHLDMPVYAKLEYNDNGDLIYEDYSDLIDYIEEHIIPMNICKDEKKDIYYIMVKSLINYKLSEIELGYTLEYLKSKNIYVAGLSITFDYEFANFNNKGNNSIIPFNDVVDVDKIVSKLAIYKNNPNTELRNEIIELCINMVKSVVNEISCNFKYTTISSEDLESYGYLGLIKAIEKYDISYDYKFSTYAYTTIRRTIVREVGASLGIDVNVYSAYYNARIFLRNELGESIDKDILITIDEIASFMSKCKWLKGYGKKCLKEYVLLLHCESLDYFMEENSESKFLEEDNLLQLYILKNIVYSNLKESFKNLTEREKTILIKYLDLDDKGGLTLRELSKMIGLSHERIRQISHDGLLKLKFNKNTLNIYDLVGDYDKYNYNPNTIVAYQNKKKR